MNEATDPPDQKSSQHHHPVRSTAPLYHLSDVSSRQHTRTAKNPGGKGGPPGFFTLSTTSAGGSLVENNDTPLVTWLSTKMFQETVQHALRRRSHSKTVHGSTNNFTFLLNQIEHLFVNRVRAQHKRRGD